MKKWYQSSLCKGILLLLSHISVGILTVCLLVGIIYPGNNIEDLLFHKVKEHYEDTSDFAGELQARSVDLLEMLRWKSILYTEGQFDQEKVIDVETFYKKEEVAEKPGDFSFRVKELLEMPYEESVEILVCKKPGEKLVYEYMTAEEFANKAEENEYHFPDGESLGESREEILRSLVEERVAFSGEVLDSEGKQIYSSVWFASVQQFFNEKTVSGKTMLQLANTEKRWNGHLTDMSEMLYQACSRINDYYYYSYIPMKDKFSQGQTNLFYAYVDYERGTVESNEDVFPEKVNQRVAEEDIDELLQKGKYVLIAPTLAQCKTNLSEDYVMLSHWKDTVEQWNNKGDDYLFIIGVDIPFQIHDEFYEQNKIYQKYMPWANQVMIVGTLSLFLWIVSIVWLTAVAGHSNKQSKIALTFFDKWKTELWLALMGALGAGIFLMLNLVDGYIVSWDKMVESGGWSVQVLILFAFAAMSAYLCAITAYLSLVRVLKAKTLWKNSICRWCCQILKVIWKQRSFLTKQILCGGILILINFMMATRNIVFVLGALAADCAVILLLAKLTMEKEQIKHGILKIADGDIDYKIPLDHLTTDSRKMAEQINHIGEGIHNAVEKSLKDERLKTDLITNVSHDIKTPLTSIINYVGLLKQEHFEDPKIQRYLEVLDQKSQRLKTLTEDVVEASKISSGNISLEFINLNLIEMIHQTVGEFTEKFEKKQLQVIVNVPEEPAIIRVDGRRMWRVIENLFNNAAKYAMPGTRVYADVVMDQNLVRFSLKNVSEYPLNITADELTERFIRGDVSRSTEGSGLGLSIAQNLTQMQGGEFQLYVDGDLFKATVTFPRIKAWKTEA